MQQLILLLHVLVAVSLIALILMQHGKGADAGAAFGSGSSNTMFGSRGSLPFLVKVTATLAALFFATSLILGYFTAHITKQAAATNNLPIPMQTTSAPSPDKTMPTN